MNSRFCRFFVLLSLVMIIMVIPVTAARGEGGGGGSMAGASGTAAPDSPVSAGGGSGYGDAAFQEGSSSPGAGEGSRGADSLHESPAPGSENEQIADPDIPGSVSMTETGYSGENSGPSLAGQGQGSLSPTGGHEGGSDDIVSQDGESRPVSKGASGESIPRYGPGEPAGLSSGGSSQVAGQGETGNSPGTGQQGPGSESPPPGMNRGQRPVLLMAASLGSAGAAWQGSDHEGPSLPAGDPGHIPQSRNRQQGPLPQPGQYPCGPAERGAPMGVAPEQKEREDERQHDSRPRTRREEDLIGGEDSGVPLSSPPDGPGLPLFSSILFLFGGYRRISRKNVLDHDLRRTIYDVICRNPGIDSVTLVMVTDINENTLRYHLAMLLAAGKITRFSRSAVARYFQNKGAFDPCDQVVWHYLWSNTPRQILMLLYRSPGLSRQNLADEIGISGPSVTRQMNQLIDEALVENRLPGRTNTYHLTDKALAGLGRAFTFRPPVSREADAQQHFLSAHQQEPEENQALLGT